MHDSRPHALDEIVDRSYSTIMGRVSDAKERLLASGRELIHQRGYTAVGVSELCAAAEVKKGSFYHFFPSKLELALEVVDGYWQDSKLLYGTLADPSIPPLERLSRYTAQVIRHHTASHRQCGQVLGCPLGNLTLEMSTQEPQLQQRLQQRFEDTLQHFEGMIRDAIAAGDIPAVDVSRTAISVLGHVEGAIMMAKMKNDIDVLSTLDEDLRRLLGAPTQP